MAHCLILSALEAGREEGRSVGIVNQQASPNLYSLGSVRDFLGIQVGGWVEKPPKSISVLHMHAHARAHACAHAHTHRERSKNRLVTVMHGGTGDGLNSKGQHETALRVKETSE